MEKELEQLAQRVGKEIIDVIIKPAENGFAPAQTIVGNIYYEGMYDVKKSYEKAVAWYTKAAEQGNKDGQHNLAVCYEYGYGVEQSYEKAVYWYNKAAEQGDVNSQNKIESLKQQGVYTLTGENQDV